MYKHCKTKVFGDLLFAKEQMYITSVSKFQIDLTLGTLGLNNQLTYFWKPTTSNSYLSILKFFYGVKCIETFEAVNDLSNEKIFKFQSHLSWILM